MAHRKGSWVSRSALMTLAVPVSAVASCLSDGFCPIAFCSPFSPPVSRRQNRKLLKLPRPTLAERRPPCRKSCAGAAILSPTQGLERKSDCLCTPRAALRCQILVSRAGSPHVIAHVAKADAHMGARLRRWTARRGRGHHLEDPTTDFDDYGLRPIRPSQQTTLCVDDHRPRYAREIAYPCDGTCQRAAASD